MSSAPEDACPPFSKGESSNKRSSRSSKKKARQQHAIVKWGRKTVHREAIGMRRDKRRANTQHRRKTASMSSSLALKYSRSKRKKQQTHQTEYLSRRPTDRTDANNMRPYSLQGFDAGVARAERSLLLSVPGTFVKHLEMHQRRKSHPCLHSATHNNRNRERMATEFERVRLKCRAYFKRAVIILYQRGHMRGTAKAQRESRFLLSRDYRFIRVYFEV